MPTHEQEQETTFYEHMQNCKELDLRDNRGKVHRLSLILLGLTLALLRNRDGKLSSIHRSMVNTHAALCACLDLEEEGVVSRSHLPVVLQKVNLAVFEGLLFDRYGIELSEEEKEWFAVDGKELRGSIEKGDKRGEALVLLVRHTDRAVLGQGRYNGTKESEKPAVQDLLVESKALGQKITADALHLCPAMTAPIAKAQGIFIIGLKENQKELFADMVKYSSCFKPINQCLTKDKGHGRLEQRTYKHYDISQEYFEARWATSNFQSLFQVQRIRQDLKTGQQSQQLAYYISNGRPDQQEDYFMAIRNHWAVEVNNHLRDVSLKEDHLRTKKKAVTQLMAGLRTLVLKLLAAWKPKNIIAQLELFQDDFSRLLQQLRKVNFL